MKTWSANTKTETLKKFVRQEAERLEKEPFNPRSRRQLEDARNFLKMLGGCRYSMFGKISDLKKKISEDRQTLKDVYDSSALFFPGYQLTVFDVDVDIGDKERKELEMQRILIQKEIRWLHKCLGICHNKDYFK